MLVTVQREPTTEFGTFGELSIDSVHQCWSLEPLPAGEFPDIPAGTYALTINRSTRFQRMLPLVLNVPGRLGIRIHPGNTDKDTEGCILLGENRTQEEVLHSAAACEAFQSKLAKALANGESATIQIRDTVTLKSENLA